MGISPAHGVRRGLAGMMIRMVVDEFDPFGGCHHNQRGAARIFYQRRNPHFQPETDLEQHAGFTHGDQIAGLGGIRMLVLEATQQRGHTHVLPAHLFGEIFQHRNRDHDGNRLLGQRKRAAESKHDRAKNENIDRSREAPPRHKHGRRR